MAETIPTIIPVVDISPYINNNSTQAERDAVVGQIGDACKNIGFFMITGHGVASTLIDELFSQANKFFDLPLEEKTKSCMPGSGSGYLPINEENLAATYGSAAPPDLKESFNISSRKQNQWPALSGFENVCTDYLKKMIELASVIMEIFALALGLCTHYFAGYINPPNVVLRLLNYPSLTDKPLKEQMRAAPHTDFGTLTILRADSPGLQVRDCYGNWIDVDAPLDSFVVNIGRMMQRWTNDNWTATVHQVINPNEDCNNRRQSIVFFHNPHDEAEISCLDTCYGETKPLRYPPIKAGEHRKQMGENIRSHA